MPLFEVRVDTLSRHHVSHEHDFHQLVLCTFGETDLSIEGTQQQITPEYGCIIPCSHHHEYEGDGRNRTLVLDMPLSTPRSTAFRDEACRLFDQPRFFRVDPALRELTGALMTQLERNPAMQDEVGAVIVRALCTSLGSKPVQHKASRQTRPHPRIDLRLINAFIDAHMDRTLTVAHLADACAISASHLHAIFRDRLDVTPHAYIQLRRLEQGRRLIRDTDWPLGVISRQIGFADQSSFSRACRRYLGVAPSRLRRPIP
ncbi:MAG: helix-turn-helix domain-containing protein [Ectothiorhodospiraceae bacterium]|nr:helix-turn-helix domain-containing protein [Ectothiorhodospiraceae bacterium]MCH8504322.1 AraC family transcriptional regulator [Ectothiorhodospiraceae bacterium]